MDAQVQEKKLPKPLTRTVILCSMLYCWDALYAGLPVIGVLIAFVRMMTNLIARILKSGKGEPMRRERYIAKSATYGLTIVAIGATFAFNIYVKNEGAEQIIKAVEGYHVEHGEYPERLDDLVPTFLSKMPRWPFPVMGTGYRYIRGGHLLVWVIYPPFGRRTYNFETEKHGLID